MESPFSRGKTKGGELVHIEPMSLDMVNYDSTIRATFEKTWSISFCEKVQTHAHDFQPTSIFSLKFEADKVRIGDLELVVSKETISQATKLVYMVRVGSKGRKWMHNTLNNL